MIDVEQPEEGAKLKYVDKLLILDNGVTLLARILIDEKFRMAEALAVYRPMQILSDADDIWMRKWIPSSIDDVYPIPLSKITTMANPSPMFVETFEEIILSGKYQSNIEGPLTEEVEEELEPQIEKADGTTIH